MRGRPGMLSASGEEMWAIGRLANGSDDNPIVLCMTKICRGEDTLRLQVQRSVCLTSCEEWFVCWKVGWLT